MCYILYFVVDDISYKMYLRFMATALHSEKVECFCEECQRPHCAPTRACPLKCSRIACADCSVELHEQQHGIYRPLCEECEAEELAASHVTLFDGCAYAAEGGI